MKKSVLAVVALSVAGLLAAAGGCIFQAAQSEAVITEKVKVEFSEYRESEPIGSVVVADEFKEAVDEILAKKGSSRKDIVAITMVSGEYKVIRPSTAGHDWTVTGRVTVRRQDDPNGPVTEGPGSFVDMTSQSLKAAQGKPVPAALNTNGVGIINNALEDLRNGGDPRLVVEMVSDSVDPAPTSSDPLAFTWRAEVTFQVVINYNKK
jgi:hypothetical protein